MLLLLGLLVVCLSSPIKTLLTKQVPWQNRATYLLTRVVCSTYTLTCSRVLNLLKDISHVPSRTSTQGFFAKDKVTTSSEVYTRKEGFSHYHSCFLRHYTVRPYLSVWHFFAKPSLFNDPLFSLWRSLSPRMKLTTRGESVFSTASAKSSRKESVCGGAKPGLSKRSTLVGMRSFLLREESYLSRECRFYSVRCS